MLLPGIDIAVSTNLPDGYDAIPGGPQWLAAAVRQGLAQVLPPDAAGQVSLLIADDATIRQLNHAYRGLDQTTDVLSFSAQHSGHWAGPDAPPTDSDICAGPDFFPTPADETPPLGDIAISLPQARRQADAAGVPLDRELALLLVHGALHLLGHDHYQDAERAAMQALEQTALTALFPPPESRR